MTKPTRPLLISYGLFGLALACFIAAIAMDPTIHGIQNDALRASETSSNDESTVEPTSSPAAQEAVQNEASEPSSRTSSPATVKDQAAAPRTAIGGEAPSMSQEEFDSKQYGGHVPFTSQPVTPGDPESYIDTVGQCPFYEMAGPKGCYPPADIECNADWSVCTPRQQ